MAKDKKPVFVDPGTSGAIDLDAAKPQSKAKLTDLEVAEFLADFRDNRSKARQEASPVFQEIIQFPGWGMAEYAPAKLPPPTTDAPPDPRLSNLQKQQIMEKQNAGKPPVLKGTPNPQNNTIMTRDKADKPNPWANSSIPAPGPCFIAIQTDVPPPWPGEWKRREGGWLRGE